MQSKVINFNSTYIVFNLIWAIKVYSPAVPVSFIEGFLSHSSIHYSYLQKAEALSRHMLSYASLGAYFHLPYNLYIQSLCDFLSIVSKWAKESEKFTAIVLICRQLFFDFLFFGALFTMIMPPFWYYASILLVTMHI